MRLACRLAFLALVIGVMHAGCTRGTAPGKSPQPQRARAAPTGSAATVAPNVVVNQGARGPRLTFRAAAKREKGSLLKFLLRNEGTKPFWFSGYSPNYPRKRIERARRTGWEEEELLSDWCGTGADYFELPAGQSVDIVVLLPDELGPIRLGVYCKPTQGAESGVLWSNTVHSSETP